MNIFGKLVATIALTICASSTSFAGESVGPRKVVSVGCHHVNASCYVTLEGANFGSTLACATGATNQFRFDDGDTAIGRRSYASFLTAYTSGQPVTVYLDGCSGQGYPKLAYFTLQ